MSSYLLYFSLSPLDEILRLEIDDLLLPAFDKVYYCDPSTDVSSLVELNIEVLIAPTNIGIINLLDQLPSIKWIHFLSAGVDPIWKFNHDFSKYTMSKSNGVHAKTIAEFAIGAMLYFIKGFGVFTRQHIQNRWERFWLEELTDKRLCIIGLGKIGFQLAKYAKVFGMHISATNTSGIIDNSESLVDEMYSSHEIHHAVEKADFIVLLAPHTEETHHLINTEMLTHFKNDSFLINLSRGGLVNENDLVEALKNNTIRGAALDVFETEPLPAYSPLWEMENVLLTPHVSGTTQNYVLKALTIFLKNLDYYLAGKQLPNQVDLLNKY